MNNMADCEGELQFIECNIKEECNIEKIEDKGQLIETVTVMNTKIKEEEMGEYNMDLKEDVGDFEIGHIGFVDVKIDTSRRPPLPEGEKNSKSDQEKTLDIFNCDLCEEQFGDMKDYESHMGMCSKKNKSKLNQQEKTTTNDKKFKCSNCDNAYEWKNCLTRHIKREHSNSIYHIHKCNHCPYKTTDQRCLRIHTLEKHNSDKKEHKCDQCSYMTHRKSRLKEHIRNMHMRKNLFQCHSENCGYKANRRSHLNTHIAVHHALDILHNGEGDKEHIFFKCLYCGNNYLSRDALARHIKIKHSNQKEFECTDCPYKATRKHCLKVHMLTVHSTEEKRYKCDHCSYTAHKKSQFDEHVRIHTNEKPFQCHYENCDYRSNRKGHLRDHLMSHHTPQINFIIDEQDETAFECAHSDNNYLSNDPLSQHSNQNPINNEKYEDNNCLYKATQQKTSLANRVANRSKECKTYKCNTCSYKAKRKYCLTDHIRNHHTPRGHETQFRCSYSLCPNSYMSRDSLKRHIKEKHLKKKR